MAANHILVKLVISEQNVQKLKLQSLSTIEDLKELVKQKANLKTDFVLQYLDEDFKDFFNLDDIENVTHLGTIKVVRHPAEKTESVSKKAETALNPWPSTFPLPNFETAVIKTSLEKLALDFSNGELTVVPEMLRRKIVASMAEEIIKFTFYPSGKDIDNMCRSLINQYPYLKDLGPGGYSTWCTCVKFRIGNLRKSLKHTVPEIATNSGKRSKENPSAPSPHTSIKKQRTGTVMVPRNVMAADDVYESKLFLGTELMKPEPNFRQIKDVMGKTWPARWRYIQNDPPIADILKEWPTYSFEQCVLMDFTRLTNVSIEDAFCPALDDLLPKVFMLGAKRKESRHLCTSLPDSIELQRDLAINVLRVLLGEKHNSPLVQVLKFDSDDVNEFKSFAIVKDGESYGVLIENNLVAKDISTLTKAMYILFAFIWVLNLQYPKDSKYIWEFVEKVLLKISPGNISAKMALFKQKLNAAV